MHVRGAGRCGLVHGHRQAGDIDKYSSYASSIVKCRDILTDFCLSTSRDGCELLKIFFGQQGYHTLCLRLAPHRAQRGHRRALSSGRTGELGS